MYEYATLASKECKFNIVNHFAYYNEEMSKKAQQNQWILAEMQNALDTNQFEIYLQPKYDLSTEQPIGAEALIRWHHPTRGLVSPGVFIPVFEKNGFIVKLDYFVWESAAKLLSTWLKEGKKPYPISVNLSRVNLYNPNLAHILEDLTKRYNVPNELLQIEITESAYMENPELMTKFVSQLQEKGFVILMDDFGSGYSSLNTLKDININILKIDMKFLSNNLNDERSKIILKSVFELANDLKTPIVMEGVETLKQVDFLRKIGCRCVQGYYYSKPIPVVDYEQLNVFKS